VRAAEDVLGCGVGRSNTGDPSSKVGEDGRFVVELSTMSIVGDVLIALVELLALSAVRASEPELPLLPPPLGLGAKRRGGTAGRIGPLVAGSGGVGGNAAVGGCGAVLEGEGRGACLFGRLGDCCVVV